VGDDAGWAGHAKLVEELLGLVFVDVHFWSKAVWFLEDVPGWRGANLGGRGASVKGFGEARADPSSPSLRRTRTRGSSVFSG
jgi:hypothetical protein